ncbi:MAG TPA: histidine kinase [Acidobacteriaceae bacterium]|nr:histidine kinase [Acidobacteriaceae bacterium]
MALFPTECTNPESAAFADGRSLRSLFAWDSLWRGREMRLGALRTTSHLGVLLPFGKALYREQALAIFRLAAALSFVVVFPFIRPMTGEYETLVRTILFGYALLSLVIMARVFVAVALPSGFLVLVHASDVIWPSLICLFTGCSRSPFLLLFIFALLAAPYRRKSLETLLVALSSVGIVLGESVVATMPNFAWLHLVRGPLYLSSFAIRAAILLMVGGFLAYTAYWTEREQQAYATRSILRLLQADAGIQTNLKEILPVLVKIFEAKRVFLLLRNSSTWRVFQWGATSDDGGQPFYRDLPSSEEDRYLWPMPMTTWSVACSRSGDKYDFLGLDRDGYRVPADARAFHAAFVWDQPFRTLLATNLQFGSEWTGRIFLVDAPCAPGREACLRLLQQVADEVGPAVYNYYLWQHTSIRVRAIERRRLARDLHDGVVQSLIATEMHLDRVRRKSQKLDASPDIAETLASAQGVLRGEVQKLRQQIEQLRSSGAPRQILPLLRDMLAEFQRETGILTTFACEVVEESLPRKVSSEVVRIVEEALSNVRKHSGARKVEVRLVSHWDVWEVVIQDDGRGFDFTGRLSLAQLDAARKGPRVIRERVHSANGELIVESYPNRGARLKIRLAANF